MNVVQFKSKEEKYVDTVAEISKKIYGKINENAEEFVNLANSIIDDRDAYPVYVHVHALERKDVERYQAEYRMLDTTKSILMVRLTYDSETNMENNRIFAFQSMYPLKDVAEHEDLDLFMTKILCNIISESVYHVNILETLLNCEDYKKYIIPSISIFMALDLFSDECAREHFLKIQYVDDLNDKIKFFDLGIKELLKKYEE